MDVTNLRERALNLPNRTSEYEEIDVVVAAEIVDQWLSEHPADSELAIDEPWLRSVGFKWSETFMTWHCGELFYEVVTHNWTLAGCYSLKALPKTRGDVRRLAAALGIQLATP